MPIVPNALERLLLGRLNVLPGLLLDYAGALAFRVAVVATRTGVFEALREGPADAAAVAQRTSLDAESTGLLLDALGALGYLRATRDGRHALSPLAR